MSTVAKAVARVLKLSAKYQHKVVRFHDTVLVQSKVLHMAKKADASADWKEVSVIWLEVIRGLQALEKGDLACETRVKIMSATCWFNKYKIAFKDLKNEALGLGFLPDMILKAFVKKRIHGELVDDLFSLSKLILPSKS